MILQFEKERFSLTLSGYAYDFYFTNKKDERYKFRWLFYIQEEKEKNQISCKFHYYLINSNLAGEKIKQVNEPEAIRYMRRKIKQKKENLRILLHKKFSSENIVSVHQVKVEKEKFGIFIQARISLFTEQTMLTISINKWTKKKEWEFNNFLETHEPFMDEYFLFTKNKDWFSDFSQALIQHPSIRLYTLF